MGDKYQPVLMEHLPYVPFDSEALSYVNWQKYVPHTYTNWREETLSWKNSCYLHANLSTYPIMKVSGPDTIKLLSYISVNNYKNFPVGSAKHKIMCNADGNVVMHGMVLRTAEDEVVTFSDPFYIGYAIDKFKFKVTGSVDPQLRDFMFQLAGPRSLEIIEQATRTDFHDLPFMRFRTAMIAGREVRVLRMGMGGTLAYEVHGFGHDVSIDVYNEIQRVGKPLGLVKLGVNQYMCNHTENGFAQLGLHFPPAGGADPDYLEYLDRMNAARPADEVNRNPELINFELVPRGTLGSDIKDYFRNPIELGWRHMINFDHEFIGREALLKIAAGRPRRMVTLEWNPEDLLKVFASYFAQGEEPYPDMPFPQEYLHMGVGCNRYFDYKVLKEGQLVGVAMWRTYTLYYRQTISLCCIDEEHAALGTEVSVLYGDVGHRSIEIRAKVARYPYLDLPQNKECDVNQVPRLAKT